MSVVEIFNPKFDTFHSTPIVTWQEKRGGIQTATNMLLQYNQWLSTRAVKDEPHTAFWESNGPAIVRAIRYCGACALVFEYMTDRKVCYKWFGQLAEVGPMGITTKRDYFYICSVTSEGSCLHGNDTRVTVTLPTDEDVVFHFHQAQMKTWFKETAKHMFKRGRNDETCAICDKDPRNICHDLKEAPKP